MKKDDTLFLQIITNKQRINDIIFSLVMLGGSIGFLTVGIASYFKMNSTEILNTNQIIFFPQGITMCFYGFFGTIISSYQVWRNKFKLKNFTYEDTLRKVNSAFDTKSKE